MESSKMADPAAGSGGTWYVLVRIPGYRRAYLLSPRDSGLTRLRVHASRFDSWARAEESALKHGAMNPECVFEAIRGR